jgi:transcriptional regulator with XRE-family HTH domain
VDRRAEAREFLCSRRAAVDPSDVGISARPARRRVQGLRREEVAVLAGISVDYYILLERGSLDMASDQVLEALARALRLDQADTAHLWSLARGPRLPDPKAAIPGYYFDLVQRLGDLPGCLIDYRQHVVAWNAMWLELHRPLVGDPPESVDMARAICSEAGRAFFATWPDRVREVAAMLRTDIVRFPDDPWCAALARELAESCPEFRLAWEQCPAGYRPPVSHAFLHPAVGLVETDLAAMRIPEVAGATFAVFMPKPGVSEAAYRRLADLAHQRASS